MITQEPITNDRKQAIGASEVSAIMGLSPWRTPWEVWAEKTDRLEPWTGNDATRAGQAYERAILDIAEAELGQLERDKRITHPLYPLAATCDAIRVLDNSPVEAKTTGLVGPVHGEWGDAGSDEIPDQYLLQVHAQLLCTEAEIAFLYALIAGRGTVRYEIRRNQELGEVIGTACTHWWDRHIIRGIEPDRNQLPRLDVVRRLRKVPNKTVELSQQAATDLLLLESCKQFSKDSKKDIDDLTAKILLALGDAEAGTLPDGTLVTYFEQSRKSYTVAATTYRQLRIKKVDK